MKSNVRMTIITQNGIEYTSGDIFEDGTTIDKLADVWYETAGSSNFDVFQTVY